MQAHGSTAADWIREEFDSRRRKNPALSLRAFARFLRVPASRLSEILSGKRPVTSGMADRFADRIGYDPVRRERFLKAVLISRPKRKSAEENSQSSIPYHSLSYDAFFAISHWYHFALLSLTGTKVFVSDEKWIAERLGVSVCETRAAVKRLARLGLLEISNRKMIRKFANLTTTHDVPSAALRNGHRELLEKNIDALEAVPIELRDFTSMTMAIDIRKLAKAKKIIKNFRRKLCSVLESGEPSEVYSLCVQLAPLSKKEKLK